MAINLTERKQITVPFLIATHVHSYPLQIFPWESQVTGKNLDPDIHCLKFSWHGTTDFSREPFSIHLVCSSVATSLLFQLQRRQGRQLMLLLTGVGRGEWHCGFYISEELLEVSVNSSKMWDERRLENSLFEENKLREMSRMLLLLFFSSSTTSPIFPWKLELVYCDKKGLFSLWQFFFHWHVTMCTWIRKRFCLEN